MPRFLPAAIAIATLALPGARASADARAVADECMCLGPETLFLDAIAASRLGDEGRLGEEGGLGDEVGLSVDGELLESLDDTIETVDPTIPSPSVDEGPPPARGPVAWCRSADDPRCQRDDNGEAPYRITLGHAPVAFLLITPRVPPPGAERFRFPRTIDHGPSGVEFPLDRPPRA